MEQNRSGEHAHRETAGPRASSLSFLGEASEGAGHRARASGERARDGSPAPERPGCRVVLGRADIALAVSGALRLYLGRNAVAEGGNGREGGGPRTDVPSTQSFVPPALTTHTR